MKFLFGLGIGALFGVLLTLFLMVFSVNREVSDQIRYDGYRLCIPHPGCMTADDYIEYYDLKYRLENTE